MKNRYALLLIIPTLLVQPHIQATFATACKVLAGTFAAANSAQIIS